jgi:hypothetical protein
MQNFIRRAVEELKDGTNQGCDIPLSKPTEDAPIEQSSHAQQ